MSKGGMVERVKTPFAELLSVTGVRETLEISGLSVQITVLLSKQRGYVRALKLGTLVLN